MQRSMFIAVSVLACLCAAQGKPRISERSGVRTLAAVADRSTIAQGSVFEILGLELGPAEPAAADVPYPDILAGVSVRFALAGDPGVSTQAYIISASAGRVVAILPSTTAPGDYLVTADVNGEATNAYRVKVAARNFGLITNTGGYGGMAQARALADGADPAPVTLASAAAPGATLEFDATGLGPIETADNQFSDGTAAAVEAWLLIGDHVAPVTTLGRNPTRPGYDRVIVTLPSENLPASCVALLQIKVGDTPALRVSLPLLAPEETSCRHPLGFSPEALNTLAAGGSIIHGGFTLVRLNGVTSVAGMNFESKIDQFAGGFVSYTPADVAVMAANTLIAGAYDANRCVVHDALDGPLGGVYVDAGENMQVAGPAWNISVPRGSDPAGGLNQYNVILNSTFNGASIPGIVTPGLLVQPGKHTLTGPGGAVVGPFSVDLEVSAPLVWTNMAATTEIDTGKDLTLLYSGGAATDTVAASGLVKGPAPEAPSRLVSRIWVCLGKGADGKITVPSSVLSQLPRVSAADMANPAAGLYSSISVSSYNPGGTGEFKAPLTAGGSTELIGFIFSYTHTKAPMPIK